ncbi:hypothetical protein PVAP13_2KG406600 [Panicum virgatum]|uniref:RING-type domain-containing protein n=1 Tax=Panicum virgatum TaxID=38727 RepID=A0A8T0W9K7_PANVG|nr:hypothetical protein PVAP13_2KG406600 [Panicum virgatum]
MGISSMPEPRDSLLGFLVYNAVISLAALAGLVRAALVFLDLGDWEADGAGSGDRLVSAAGPGPAERMQRVLLCPARLGPIPGVTTTCGAAAAGDDCSVCLAGFGGEAVVNRLPCGHLFHRGCLETWLRNFCRIRDEEDLVLCSLFLLREKKRKREEGAGIL